MKTMTQTTAPAAVAAVPAGRDGCRHHWVIEGATLPLSKGTCQSCGEERWFRNHFRWEEIAPVSKLERRAVRGQPASLETGGPQPTRLLCRA